MITRVEVMNYRCLKYISQPLDHFRLLVGPNASGKSTFLDVFRLIRDILTPEIQVVQAMGNRSEGNPLALAWLGEPAELQFAIELAPPPDLLPAHPGACFRYEMAIEVPAGGAPSIAAEALFVYPDGKTESPTGNGQRALFPDSVAAPETILALDGSARPRGRHKVVSKAREGRDYYQWKLGEVGKQTWNQSVHLGRQRAALAYLPVREDDPSDPFHKVAWVRRFLTRHVVDVHLDIDAMRKPAPPTSRLSLQPDGSNMAWTAQALAETKETRWKQWIEHVGSLLPGLVGVSTEERDFDRHCVLRVHYDNGAVVPSWLVSDGTLRLLALTLLAYDPHEPSLYLIEEPENGVHPTAVDGVMESLTSMYDDQVLVATHSLPVLSQSRPAEIICFGVDPTGATDVTPGEHHPYLADWQENWSMADITASGILA
ncbi:MAG: AAA family ATPase [Armatimonadia bacterium]|nr:AAA family ATPase [Armatimonadia bacterium]